MCVSLEMFFRYETKKLFQKERKFYIVQKKMNILQRNNAVFVV